MKKFESFLGKKKNPEHKLYSNPKYDITIESSEIKRLSFTLSTIETYVEGIIYGGNIKIGGDFVFSGFIYCDGEGKYLKSYFTDPELIDNNIAEHISIETLDRFLKEEVCPRLKGWEEDPTITLEKAEVNYDEELNGYLSYDVGDYIHCKKSMIGMIHTQKVNPQLQVVVADDIYFTKGEKYLITEKKGSYLGIRNNFHYTHGVPWSSLKDHFEPKEKDPEITLEAIANNDSRDYVMKHIDFKGSHLSGRMLDKGIYVVLSYGYYPIYLWKNGKWYGNEEGYSNTTKKQMHNCRPDADITYVSTEKLKKLATVKHMPKYERGARILCTKSKASFTKGKEYEIVKIGYDDFSGAPNLLVVTNNQGRPENFKGRSNIISHFKELEPDPEIVLEAKYGVGKNKKKEKKSEIKDKKFKIGDKLLCIRDFIMKDETREFTQGLLYTIVSVDSDDMVNDIINNSGDYHYMCNGRSDYKYIEKYFRIPTDDPEFFIESFSDFIKFSKLNDKSKERHKYYNNLKKELKGFLQTTPEVILEREDLGYIEFDVIMKFVIPYLEMEHDIEIDKSCNDAYNWFISFPYDELPENWGNLPTHKQQRYGVHLRTNSELIDYAQELDPDFPSKLENYLENRKRLGYGYIYGREPDPDFSL
jgi:hypothetical protein